MFFSFCDKSTKIKFSEEIVKEKKLREKNELEKDENPIEISKTQKIWKISGIGQYFSEPQLQMFGINGNDFEMDTKSIENDNLDDVETNNFNNEEEYAVKENEKEKNNYHNNFKNWGTFGYSAEDNFSTQYLSNYLKRKKECENSSNEENFENFVEKARKKVEFMRNSIKNLNLKK